ncbi:hypothetical protein ACFOU2_20180 [Bacillus songklensis]|uniref:Uncharacterized protein n=1 Tax=Bacillus songklensis TaxID=1069116 RepID=A0ABV8B8J6_9BACI
MTFNHSPLRARIKKKYWTRPSTYFPGKGTPAFPYKDELLATIFHNFRRDIVNILPPIEQLHDIIVRMTPEQFLHRGVQNFMDHIDDPIMEKIWRIVYNEQYRDSEARDILLQDITYRTLDFLEIVFEKMMELKRIRRLSPRLLDAEYQYPLFAMVAEYNLLHYEQKDTKEVVQRMADHVDFFIENVQIELLLHSKNKMICKLYISLTFDLRIRRIAGGVIIAKGSC